MKKSSPLIVCTLFLIYCAPIHTAQTTFANRCIILAPAGNSSKPGRVLHNNFERGITLQCVQMVQRELEARIPSIRVLVTREAGQIVEPLHNAQWANRLQADLYLSIHFYKQTVTCPHWYLYYFKNTLNSFSSVKELSLLPYDMAYRVSYLNNKTIIEKLYSLLTHYGPTLAVDHPYGIPHTALIGLTIPACALDIGLPHDEDWKICATIIVEALEHLISHL